MKKIIFLALLTLVITNSSLAESVKPSQILGENYHDELQSDAIQQEEKKSRKVIEDPKSLTKVPAKWKRGDIDAKYLKVNNIQFTNRSSCADDSTKPATQVNILIDSMNAAKAVYRLALATGNDPKALTKQAVSRFRYTSYKLIEYIANQIFEGRLPLLHADRTTDALRERFKAIKYISKTESNISKRTNYKRHILKEYSSIMEDCKLEGYCEELDLYIEKIWNNKKYTYREETTWAWTKVDNFTNEHFLAGKLLDKKEDSNLGCHFLKKFSPYMAQVSTVAANKKILDSLAIAGTNQNEYITTCDDLDAQSSLEAVAYQLDIVGVNSKTWNKAGFDFWHSLKLYYSWAFRNAEQAEQMSYPFSDIFKSVYLEESVMLFPTGCKGISPAHCDNEFLSTQRIREFAKKNYSKNALNQDFMKALPQGAEKDLLDDPFVDYNNDILEYGKFPDMNDWAKRFAQNLRKSRSFIKKRLVKGIELLEISSKALSPNKIASNLDAITKDKSLWSLPGDDKISIEKMKNELYYLCSEYNVAAHETLSFVKADLNYLSKLKNLDPIFNSLSANTLKEQYNYFEQVAPKVLAFCEELEEKGIWKGFEVKRNGFSEWYKELMFKSDAAKSDEITSNKVWGTPLLKNKGENTVANAICFNGVDCARQILESVTSIYSAAKYFKTFFVNSQEATSPSLINPYAERTACKIYDPWWKVKRTLFYAFSDLTAAAVSYVNPTPFYINLDYVPQRAISFNKMMDDGELKFDPQMSGSKWFGSLNLDLTKILKIPCQVSVGNHTGALPSSRSYFSGYSFKGCIQHENGGEITVRDASDINVNTVKAIQGCASCTINFETMANWAATFINVPVVSTSYYLIRGIVRFYKGFSDPIEIPRRWEINPNSVIDTYRRYGTIPKKCVKRLTKGGYCMPSKCEHAITEAAGKLFGTQVTYLNEHGDAATVKLKHCSNKIQVVDTLKMGLFCRSELTRENFWEDSSCNFPKEQK